jgi:hypothetical protein
MADIFISYSKADHALALKLSAFLEAEGWSVWWDKSLAAADLYRDEIMKQLAAARAVITIWTPNSIRSDWVRAEAGTAKNEGKLIPVKTTDVAYADIPLPFGEMHTENLGSSELIRAAVVAQLAKPAVEPSAVALLTRGFKYELLTWFGIVGGALTLFTNLGSVLKLADWVALLVHNWKGWTHTFWLWTFGWVGIHLPPGWPPILSFLSFWSLLAIGQAVKFTRAIKDQPGMDKYQGRSFRLLSWWPVLCLVLTLIFVPIVAWILEAMWPLYYWFLDLLEHIGHDEWQFNRPFRLIVVAPVFAWVLSIFFAPLAIAGIICARQHRLHAVVAVLLLAIFWDIITFDILVNSFHLTLIAAGMLWVLSVLLLSVAPAKAVSRRLIFLALGLLLLIALNELSTLGLDVTAPKLQG